MRTFVIPVLKVRRFNRNVNKKKKNRLEKVTHKTEIPSFRNELNEISPFYGRRLRQV